MPIDTPAWVRDAVFYQIFPDRFASSDRVEKPGRLEPWDSPPTVHGFKGGDLLGIEEHLDYLEDLGDQRAVPDADLPVGCQSSLPHVRLPDGRPAPRRERGTARAARRGPRPRHAGRARWRVQSHRARLLAVPPRPRERCRCRHIAAGSTSTTRRSTPARRSERTPSPERGAARRSAIARGGDCRPCRS